MMPRPGRIQEEHARGDPPGRARARERDPPSRGRGEGRRAPERPQHEDVPLHHRSPERLRVGPVEPPPVSAVALPRADRPLVSVVMVTFGGWPLTRRALEALAEHTALPFEVGIVDNPTPEDVAARLRQELTGAEVLENDRNEGFGPAATRGAERARGELVLFLNTDT